MKNELGLSVIQSEFQSEFGNYGLLTFMNRGRPVWMAKDVGRVLGYSNHGMGFVKRLTQEWSDEIHRGEDYIVLQGKDLASFKKVVSELIPENGITYAPSLILLYETGLNLAVEKTNKPIGKKLRRFIASEVLPQIARDGAYDPSRQIINERLVGGRNESEATVKERRLIETEQRRRAELELRRAEAERKNKAFKKQVIDELYSFLEDEGRVDKNSLTSLRIKSAELASDEDFSNLKPETAPDWLSPTAIGEKFGVTANRIGRIISDLNLRGNPRYERAITNIAPDTHREVVTFLWSPEAVYLIEEELHRRNGTPVIQESPYEQ